jgi:hypothetical protein
LLGPPLVGIFELEPSEMQSMDFSDIEWNTVHHNDA